MIAMLRDAPLSFLAATAIVPLLVVAVVELESKLSAVKSWLFVALIGALAAVYIRFVAYAINHASRGIAIGIKLETFRNEGLLLEQKTRTSMTAFEYADWQKQLGQWQDKTADYLNENVGDAAKNRFLSTLGRGSLSYGSDQQFNSFLNALVGQGKNLQDIIDGHPHPRESSLLLLQPSLVAGSESQEVSDGRTSTPIVYGGLQAPVR